MDNGGDMFIIAFEPMNTYNGAHQRIPPTDKMKEGETNGVLIVKEISKVRTCKLLKRVYEILY